MIGPRWSLRVAVAIVGLVFSFWRGHVLGHTNDFGKMPGSDRPVSISSARTPLDRGTLDAAETEGTAAAIPTAQPAMLEFSSPGHVVPSPNARQELNAATELTTLDRMESQQNIDFGIRRTQGRWDHLISTEPGTAFTLHDDGNLLSDTQGPQLSADELSAGGNSRIELQDSGQRQRLAQGQPPTEAPSDQTGAENLARQLANPISSLISVPFQSNFNFGIGPTQGGFQYLLNIQPVYPVSMSADWNFITRMIMPVIYQNEIFPGAGSQFGLGDTTFQFFFSPKQPTKAGIIWGVGPTLFVPTGTDRLLSGRTWGAGLDGVVLTQIPQKSGVWTAGILASQTWGFAGPAALNALLLQPFLAFTFPNTVTITLQSQSTLNWNTGQWTVPIIASASRIFKFGDQLTSIGLGVKYYPVSPVGQPTWGLQATVTLLFPTR